MELLVFFAEIAVTLGGLLYRFLPSALRNYVDLDSGLGELLAFGVGAVVLVAISVAAWAVFS